MHSLGQGQSRLLIALCIVTAFINLLLLLPTPFDQIKDIKAYYDIQRAEQVDDLTIEDREANIRVINFSEKRKIREVWLRWCAVASLYVLQILSVVALVRSNSRMAYVGVKIVSTVYLLGWFFSIIIPDGGAISSSSIMDSFVFRILNEVTIASDFMLLRFFLLYCFNPLLFVAILKSMESMVDSNSKCTT